MVWIGRDHKDHLQFFLSLHQLAPSLSSSCYLRQKILPLSWQHNKMRYFCGFYLDGKMARGEKWVATVSPEWALAMLHCLALALGTQHCPSAPRRISSPFPSSFPDITSHRNIWEEARFILFFYKKTHFFFFLKAGFFSRNSWNIAQPNSSSIWYLRGNQNPLDRERRTAAAPGPTVQFHPTTLKVFPKTTNPFCSGVRMHSPCHHSPYFPEHSPNVI